MTPCPKIVTHESADAPPAHRFIASFYNGSDRLPILFADATREGAIRKASDWWAAEQARLAKIAATRAARSANMRKVG